MTKGAKASTSLAMMTWFYVNDDIKKDPNINAT